MGNGDGQFGVLFFVVALFVKDRRFEATVRSACLYSIFCELFSTFPLASSAIILS